jgi:hypothetical protein
MREKKGREIDQIFLFDKIQKMVLVLPNTLIQLCVINP